MSWPTFSTVQLMRQGGITWMRMNRPQRLNALSEESFCELGSALGAVAADGETRVMVLTGNGPGFCSGSDVNGLEERFTWKPEQQLERLRRYGREVVLRLYGLPVPTIAAVNGPAAGGGLSLALACDIRVAADDATLTFGYTGVGLIPDLGATYFLPAAVGVSRACHLLWTGARLTAAEAREVGLVESVVPAAEFETSVEALARQIAAAPRLAVSLGRQSLRRGGRTSLEEALETEAVAQSLCLQSAEHRAGVRDFLGRRAGREQAAGVSGTGAPAGSVSQRNAAGVPPRCGDKPR